MCAVNVYYTTFFNLESANLELPLVILITVADKLELGRASAVGDSTESR